MTKLMTRNMYDIVQQLFENETKDKKRVLTFYNFFPQKDVNRAIDKKVFKAVDIKKKYNYNVGMIVYELEYKDLYKYTDLTSAKFECWENEQYKKKLKGYFDDKHKVNDLYRTELECPNWSSQKDEYGYASCPFNNREYEPLDPQDNVVLNFKLQGLGYKDYEDFANQHRELTKEQLQTVLSEELDTLEEMSIARHWEV